VSTTGETLLSMISCSMNGDSEVVEGGTDMGIAMMLQKSEPSGFRITSVTFHPAESAMSVVSRRVLSLLLKVTCICSILRITIWQEEQATCRHVEPKRVRACLAEVRQKSARGWCQGPDCADTFCAILASQWQNVVRNNKFSLRCGCVSQLQ
jgi:hypothetical protein